MNFETMYFEKEGRIGYLTLNRPQLLNAMNYQGALDLNRAAEMIRDEPDLRLVLIKGTGRAFCTGIDLKQLTAGETPHHYYESWDRALRILEQSEKILVCAMHGYALGGGLQLALAYEIGLTDHLVNRDTFDDEVNALVEKYSRVCSEGTRQAKMLLNMSFDMPHGQFFDEYLRRQRIALASPDHQEAMAAYREKREPNFST